MTSRFRLASFAVITLLAAATHAASAQAASSPAPALPKVAGGAVPGATRSVAAPRSGTWDAHPTGKYVLELALPDGMMEASLTISDSGGIPVALFLPVGDNEAHPLSVTIDGADLKLYASTPRGPFNMTLNRDGDHLTGQFSMGSQESGSLEGHVERSSGAP